MALTTSTEVGITPFSRRVLVVWLLYALSGLAIVLTYSRLSPDVLYHVSNDGLRGGLSRLLVYLNYPVAFVAIALGWLSVAVIRMRGQSSTSPWLLIAAVVGTGLCLVATYPGVVDQGDLDAKPVNAIPIVGVMIGLALSVIAIRGTTPTMDAARSVFDWIGLGLIVVATFVALPIIVADLGFYIDDVPLLNRIFVAREVPAGETLPTVHPGHHHGVDGLLFIVTAVVLVRPWRALSAGPIRSGLGAYLAFMMGYGIANLANDVWYEQMTKRGVTEYEIPSFVRPEVRFAWLIVILGMVVIWGIFFRGSSARLDSEDVIRKGAMPDG